MYVLGIHDGHNASAALMKDGRIVAAVQEERPRGVKNALGMPWNAIDDVLSQADIKPQDVDFVALAGMHSGEYLKLDQSLNPSEQILTWHGQNYEKSWFDVKQAIRNVMPDSLYEWLKGDRIREMRLDMVTSLGFRREGIRLVEHHTAHAASAYYGWGKLDEPILILTNDGMGDDICATVSIGENGKFTRIASVPYTESVAEVYALTTYLMGMVPLEHEYKLMGMAPYASPRRADVVYSHLKDLVSFKGKGGMTWKRHSGMPPLGRAYHELEKVYRRQRFDSICGGIQKFTEEFLKEWVTKAIRETGIRKVALAGGIFMNVKANRLILELAEVDDLFIFPSCGDETNAIGAAYWITAEEMGKTGHPISIHPLQGLYWGRSFHDQESEDAIAAFNFSQRVKIETPSNIERSVAQLLAQGRVVARCAGRMEFGARALGNRSILGNPSDSRVIKIINEMIKQRDFWMPFAPSVAAEKVHTYLRKPKDVSSHYMTLTFESVPEKREAFLAGIHPYDGTARPQEVLASHNEPYHRLIQYFGELTGEEIILNTSFNLHGFPVVYTPHHALQTFDQSGLQCLALGPFLLTKSE